MRKKNWLTLFNCVMAIPVYLMGAAGARQIGDEHPLGALMVALAGLLFPVYLATRISWASGYEAGRREHHTYAV